MRTFAKLADETVVIGVMQFTTACDPKVIFTTDDSYPELWVEVPPGTNVRIGWTTTDKGKTFTPGQN